MITPRLYRRALRQAAQWRLLALWWASLLVPGTIAALPAFRFLSGQLDHSTRAREAVAALDGSTLLELARQFGQNGNADAAVFGVSGAVLTLLLIAPFMAGAMIAAARSDEPLRVARLLAGAGELYGRMLRTALCGLVPLAIFGGLSAAIAKFTTARTLKDLTETAADAHLRNAAVAVALLLFVGHLLVDATRAVFAAEPTRRSAVLAMWRGVRLFVRRPVRVLGVGALGTVVALGVSALLMALRLRIPQATPGAMAGAWMMAQAAQIALGYGRAVRIAGLSDLARADAADRARPFRLDPPTSSPPAVVQSATLSALVPPLSPRDASGT